MSDRDRAPAQPLADGAGDPVRPPGDRGDGGDGLGGQVIFSASAGPETARWHWSHLKRSAATEAALHAEGRLPGEVVDTLLEHDTLPRTVGIEEHTIVILRAINRTHGAEPEDMISLRLAIAPHEIVSIEGRRLRQIDRMIEIFQARPPATPSAFLAALVTMLRADAEPVLDELEDEIATLEHRMLKVTGGGKQLTVAERTALMDVRQDAIQLHRYIAPQAAALDGLMAIKPGWLADKRSFRSEAAGFRRIAADLEALRQRAQLVAEEANMAVMERTNRLMLTLSVASVVFLPITALTGLLGVNLAGIPYAESAVAFQVFCLLLLAVGGFAAWLAIRMLR